MACRPLSWPTWQVMPGARQGSPRVQAAVVELWETLGLEGSWAGPQPGGLQQGAALESPLVLLQASPRQRRPHTSSGSHCLLSHCWPRPSHLGPCPRKGHRR